ncbi:zinc finger, CCHC-type containing protein [Tanacetum coccineum]
MVQNGCSFHGLRSEDPNQHLKDFLKLVDSLDLDGENRERTRLRLFQFSLRDQASNWLERLPAGSISTWEDLTTRFLAQFFPPGRTAKLRNDILMFQQHHGESLSKAWTRFKDLLQKVPHHGIDLWLQVQIFYDHVNPVTRRTIDQSAGGKLRDLNAEESWALLEDLALYDNEMVPQLSVLHEGLVSEFMASQDARLTKFEADFKRQQGEMTNKIDTMLKAITDQIAGALPSDTVRKLNSMLESLGLVPRSYNAKFICSKEDDGELMFIEIIRDDEPQYEDPNKGEGAITEGLPVEYFDTFLTRDELTYYRYLMSGPIPSIFLRNPLITRGISFST